MSGMGIVMAGARFDQPKPRSKMGAQARIRAGVHFSGADSDRGADFGPDPTRRIHESAHIFGLRSDR